MSADTPTEDLPTFSASSRPASSKTKFAPGRRGQEPNASGFPIFCRTRHFVRGANVYSVPLWDLTSRWLPEELKPYASSSSSAAPKVSATSVAPKGESENGSRCHAQEEDKRSANLGSEIGRDHDDEASESEQSEVCWEGPLGGESRVWSRGAVEGSLLLLRRVQASGSGDEEQAAVPSYGLGISAALFSQASIAEGADSVLDKRLAQVLRTREPVWAVCALRSGHFAGAIFQGQEALVHKAIHRYTVRAKAGGAQSACDSTKKVKSVGSSLRRYGETRLAEEIKELMTEKWASELSSCELVLVSVSNRMRSTLLGTEKEPFLQDNSKVRKLPFMVGRPTFEAVKDAYLKVASVIFADEKTAESLSARFRPAVTKPRQAVEIKTKEVSDAPAKQAQVPTITKYCEEEDELYTPLHAAAAANDEDKIFDLLDDGADPGARDGKGRVPYYLCTSQKAREAFRRYRGQNEDEWDWVAAQVPESITEETDQKKKEKEKEKRRRQKEKQKVNKAKEKEAEAARVQREEEEKRMLEEAQAKCDSCRKPLVSKPFERLHYLYCSPECVAAHRRQLQAEAASKRLGI